MVQCYGGPLDGAKIERERIPDSGFLKVGLDKPVHRYSSDLVSMVWEAEADGQALSDSTATYELVGDELRYLAMRSSVL